MSADITLEPGALGGLAGVLRTGPRDHGWFLVQRASPFGGAMGVGSPHPSRADGSSATVSLDFGDDPVPEAIENGRFGRWLAALARAGLLPPAARPDRLMERFAAAFPQRPSVTRTSPRDPPPAPVAEGGVSAAARGWRAMRGDRDRYWPGACVLTVPVPPVTALGLAAPLLGPGGPVDFHGYYSPAVLGTAGLAGRLAAIGGATFVLDTTDGAGAGIDEPTLDALLGSVGDDLVCVDWQCDWPDAAPGYNGVQLTVNGAGNLHDDDPEHVPGLTTAYFTVHPRAARDGDRFAARLASQAGLRLAVAVGGPG
jgi:hypothetical protein